MANLLKTFSSSIDIVDGPVHQIFPEPNILSRTSVVEDYKVISLVANESFAVVITISNNGALVDLTGPTDDEMNASIFDDTTVASVDLATAHDAGLSDLANGVIAFICPVDTLPSTFANSFNRKPLGTVEIDFKITVGGHTVYIYDRVNVIDNAFGGTGAVLPVSATQFVSKAEIVDTSTDEVQLGVRAHSAQTANIFEVQDDSEVVTAGFNSSGEVFGLSQTEITGKTEVTVDAADHILISDASDSGALKKILASDLIEPSGDVVGPASAVDENLTVFDSTTGKLIKDSGVNVSAVTANTAKVTNSNHTGHITGSTATTLQSVAITDQTTVTPVTGDFILLSDTSDSGNLKKVDAADFLSGSGDMLIATYDPTAVSGDAFARANMTGTQASSTISDFETTVAGTVRSYTKQQSFGTTTLSDGANISWDLDDNQVSKVTLAGNRTLDNPTNMVDGGTYILRVIQDATGSRTLSFGTAYRFPSGTAPTLTTAANAVDYITFISDGTNMDAIFNGDFS